jgi:hypothetical protein
MPKEIDLITQSMHNPFMRVLVAVNHTRRFQNLSVSSMVSFLPQFSQVSVLFTNITLHAYPDSSYQCIHPTAPAV